MELELEILLSRCKHADRKAQNMLYKRYKARMANVCRRYLNDKRDAEDALSLGFFNILTKLHQFTYTSDKEAEGWMQTIVVRICLMRLRNEAPMLVPVTDEIEIESDEDALRQLIQKEGYEKAYKKVLELPIPMRFVFCLHELDGISHAEIGKNLGFSEGASRNQLCQAKKRLKTMLKGDTNLFKRYKMPIQIINDHETRKCP